MKKGTAISIFLILILVSWIPTISSDEPVFSTTLYVGGSGPGNYTHIQDAIDDASNGDTVFVYSGLYIGTTYVNKSINLIGEDKNNTIISKGQKDDVITITASNVFFSGFTIRFSTTHFAGCYVQGADYCIIDDNIFENSYGCGVWVTSDYNKISNNIFLNNSESGIVVAGYNNEIFNNFVANNGLYGIEVHHSSNLIYHNSFINNEINHKNHYGTSQWYNDTLNEGNFWSDYEGVDENEDGIGDTSYNIGNSDADDLYPLMNPLLPPDMNFVNQSTHDRGFPIRHALDGDWAAAQSFCLNIAQTRCEIYLRKFGSPEFNLTVELRQNHPEGLLLDTLIFTPEEIPTDWDWLNLDFEDFFVEDETEMFIVIPPAPSGVTTSFGYEWGYAFGNKYDDGSFWFTRDGGGLWRDLPTMYEFVFRTYGYT